MRTALRTARKVSLLVCLALTGLPVSAEANIIEDYDYSTVTVQGVPATMHPGQIVTATVVVRNEGLLAWEGELTGTNPVRLATVGPRDRVSTFGMQDATWMWSGGRRIRMAAEHVPSGGIASFTFTFRAPILNSYPVTFIEYFAPLVEGVHWMDTKYIPITTRVVPVTGAAPGIPSPTSVPSPSAPPTPTPPAVPTPTPTPGDAWELVAATPAPASMHPGAKVVLSVSLRNSGTTTWHSEDLSTTPMRLAAVNAIGTQPRERASLFGRQDPTWLWSNGTRIRMTTPQVEPGGVGSFEFTFTAPTLASYPQTFIERFAPIIEGQAPLDNQVISFSTQVRPAASVAPPIQETPDFPSPSPVPLPTVSPLPTPSVVPSPLPTPTDDPTLPSLACQTSGSPTPGDTSVAAAANYVPSGDLLKGKISGSHAIAYGFGKIFAADTANDRIVRTDPAGFVTDYFGSPGSGPGQLRWPSGLALSESGLVFVADTGNHRIQVYGVAGVYVSTFGSAGTGPGEFQSPRGIAMISTGPLAGNLAVADTGNDRIQIVTRTGVPVLSFGAPGQGPGQFSSPSSVSVWGDYMYVADTGNERVQRISLDGTFEGAWGGSGTDGGCTSLPTGVLATSYGVFVSESGTGRVQRFTRWGAYIEAFGSMSSPSALTMDPSSRIYVSDSEANHVSRFTPSVAAAPATP